MTRPPMVTLTVREEDARWLAMLVDAELHTWGTHFEAVRILREIRHALAECACEERGESREGEN